MRVQFVLLGLILAGCTAPSADDPEGDAGTFQRLEPPFDQMPKGPGHDHSDHEQHQFLWNYAFTHHDPLMANQANAAGLHALDLKAGHLFGAVYGSHTLSIDGGLQIWDVTTDPTKPIPKGRWAIPGSVGGDRSVAATSDGNYVVIGLEPVTCFGHANPAAGAASAYLIDTRDKSRPIPVDAVTAGGTLGSPGGFRGLSTHSVWVHEIGGKEYAFIFGDIYEIRRGEGSGASLVFVTTINVGHDVYVRDTPWNRTWALAANGRTGLVVYDVTDVANPVPIGDFTPAEEGPFYFHTADVAFFDQQVLIIFTSEDFNREHASPFWVIDGNPLRNRTTQSDDNLTALAKWTNPGGHIADNVRFSLHNPRFHDDGILSLSSYHAGVFQFDFRHPSTWTDPALVAGIAYAAAPPPVTRDPVEQAIENSLCKLYVTADAPMVMDVVAGDQGILYLADVFGGLHTFQPTESHPVYMSGK